MGCDFFLLVTEWRYSRQTNCIALRLSFFGVVLVAQSVFRQSWRWQTADSSSITRWSASKTRWLRWRLELTLLSTAGDNAILPALRAQTGLPCTSKLLPLPNICSSSGAYRFSKYLLQAEVNKELAEPTEVRRYCLTQGLKTSSSSTCSAAFDIVARKNVGVQSAASTKWDYIIELSRSVEANLQSVAMNSLLRVQ